MTVPQRNEWVPPIWNGGACSFTSGHPQAPIQMQHLIKKVSHKIYHLHFLVSFLTKGHNCPLSVSDGSNFVSSTTGQLRLNWMIKTNLILATTVYLRLKRVWKLPDLLLVYTAVCQLLLFPWVPRRGAECYYLHAEMKPSPRSQWARRGTYIQTARGSPCPQ